MHRARPIRATLFLAARVALLVLLAANAVHAQRLQFRHLRSGDGLAGPWVQAITQDHRGFMWFGTSQGLNRYDGYKMQLFRHEKGDSLSLPDNTIHALLVDTRGTLWIGTRAGLSRYDREHDRFINYMTVEGETALVRRQVRALGEDSRGNLWVGTTEGLFLFDRRTERASEYALPATAQHGKQEIQSIFEDRRKHILIGTMTDGLFDLDPATGALHHYAHAHPGTRDFPGNRIASVVEDRRGRLWVSAFGAGLIELYPGTGRYVVHDFDGDSTKRGKDQVGRSAVDSKGWIWLAFENAGLAHFDPNTGTYQRYRSNPDNVLGPSSDAFWSLYLDASGTLWGGTFASGVDVLRPATEAIQRFSTIPGDTTSLSLNSVLGFAQDSSGKIWIATDGGGLDRLDPATSLIRRYTKKNTTLRTNSVLGLSIAPDGGVWAATWGAGLVRFDPRTERFAEFSSKNTDLQDDHFFSAHVDRLGRIWIGTWQRGLARFDPTTRSFTEYHFGVPGNESQIWLIRELHDGRLALGTLEAGLLIFDPITARFERYGTDHRNGMSIGAMDVRALLEESPGILWVGTSAGLDRLDLTANTAARLTTRDGLPSNVIEGLARGGSGTLWLSTDVGVAHYDYRNHRAVAYTVDDGLQEREFTARSYLATSDGAMLFGGNNGFNLIRPALIAQNARAPRVVFSGFQLFNKPVVVGAPHSPLTTEISEAREIQLDHTQSVFTIEFAALDFTAPAKNQYAYKLDGFDENWTFAGTTRSATYTNLPPGTYVFRVKASNNDGVWNEQGASLVVRIIPPVWGTWWFRALAALAVIAYLTFVVRDALSRHHALQAMNERLGRANEQLGLAAEHDRDRQQYLEHNVLDMLGAMERFSGGDYSVVLDVESDDAIGRLRAGFNSAVADRKRAEDELRQSQKMEAVGRLAGGVAHDFNNLLTVIKGNTELALQDSSDAMTVREELGEIKTAAERAAMLTRQLLAFSRKQILKPQTISLNEVVVEVGRMLQRTLGEDIDLTIALDSQNSVVRADPGQVQQVLLNLAVNARDAMPRGGNLRIEARAVSPAEVRDHPEAGDLSYVALIVSDTGAGMEPAVLDRIFEPFFTTKEQGKGTGLGLSTVYGIVSQSGGYVRVHSQPNRGSCFTVYLPKVDAEPEPRTNDVGMDHGHSETVLLVEDEASVRLLSARVLRRAGYNVLVASHGTEALAVAADHEGQIDLLLTDVVMPGMGGRELAQRLVPQRPGMRLLYTSGYTEDQTVRHGVSGLGTAFLEKPFTPDGLTSKVREVLLRSPVGAVG